MSLFASELGDLPAKTEFEQKLADATTYQGSQEFAAKQAQQLIDQKNARINHIAKVIKNHFSSVNNDTCNVADSGLQIYVGDLEQTVQDDLKTTCESKGYTVTVEGGRMKICHC